MRFMIKDLGFKNKYEAGQAMMIATIFFLVISITIVFGLVGPIARQQKMSYQALTSRQSYFLAEAGMEDVVFRLKNGTSVSSTEVLSLGGSSATTVTTDTGEGKTVVATGVVKQLLRKVESDLILGEGVAFHYGIQIGTGGFVLSNNAGVNGNVYSNGSISGQNGSFITGDALAIGSVVGVDVGGDTETGVESADFPITDQQIADWKSEAEAGGVVSSQTISDTTSALGPKKISGNLNLDNGARLTVTGTLWITGNLVLNNNSQIILSGSYGSGDGVIVVDGTSTFSNGASMEGSGTTGSYLMLLTTSASGNAISLSNNAGGVILYAPNGTIQISNNASLTQLVAKTVSLSNNAIIDYEQGIINAGFTNGPGGGYSVVSWKEVQ